MKLYTKLLVAFYFIIVSINSKGILFDSQEDKERRELQYFNENDYLKLPASEKMALLFSKIRQTQDSFGYYNALEQGKVLLQDNTVTFNHIGDVLPEGRKKLIHTSGVIAKVEFVVTGNNKYTGILKQGSKYSLLRLSAAKKFTIKKKNADSALNNFIGGLSWKVLVDKQESVNLVAMYNTVGTDSWNFFKESFTNVFQIRKKLDILNKFIAIFFSKVTKFISSVGIYEFAAVYENGKKTEETKYPFRLLFKPNPKLSNQSDEYTEDYMEIIMRIPINTLIYEVYAIESPNSKPVKIGEMYSRSEFTKSLFGDQHLFFRHQRIEDDDLFYPERVEGRDTYSVFKGVNEGTESRTFIEKESKCPFRSK